MRSTGWLVLLAALLVPGLAHAEGAGWRVTWTDWCYTSWAREGGGNNVPPDMLGDYTEPVPVTCFSASLQGIGHELVFRASGGFWLTDIWFWAGDLSGGDSIELSVTPDDAFCWDRCSVASELVFTSALHLGHTPPERLGVEWTALTFWYQYPVYRILDVVGFRTCASTSAVDPATAAPGVDFCAPGTYRVELLNHSATPEPVSMALLGTGLAGVFGARRRRRGVAQER